jgi:hypothetical protein
LIVEIHKSETGVSQKEGTMVPKNRSLVGTPAQPIGNSKPLTFNAALMKPPQSQVQRSEDAVSDRVGRLDVWAEQLGRGFGISYTNFELNPIADDDAMTTNARALILALRQLTHRAERITLERRGGKWGLYFTREPALVAQERRAEPVPLKDSPLDVRERFLRRSQEFFRAYLKLCEDRLGTMNSSVESADATLQLLENVSLQ